MKNIILREMKHHAPFTLMGALSGIALGFFFYNIPRDTAYRAFYVLHPIHVVLSALVTASLYKKYKCRENRNKCGIFTLLAIGLVGSIGIATLSDSLVPYLGESLLRMEHAEAHIGFIEEWKIILPSAVLGVALAYFWPSTKMPHSGHVLISTWASLFHILMAGPSVSTVLYGSIVFGFLFLSVWLPCCVSDIVFPLLFIKDDGSVSLAQGHDDPANKEI